jgi:biopolymer transport protein ExbD
MRASKRMLRMERTNQKGQIVGLGLNLIPLMDVMTVLIFFLLFHSFNAELPSAKIELPESLVETKPRETVHVVVTPTVVLVQDEPVANTAQVLEGGGDLVAEVAVRLQELERYLPPMKPEDRELTLLADKTIQFKVLKKIMSTCTAAGYGKISLAVIQKEIQKD